MDSIGTVTLGFGAWVEKVSGAALHTRVVIFAAFFVVFTLAMSSYLLFQHLSTYSDPSKQRWLIGIIFMIPIYSIASFVSLWAPEISIECNILGNCYEAFAMYSFGRYLIACLGEKDWAVIQKLESQDSIGPRKPLLDDHSGDCHLVHHPVPFSWFLEPWQLGQQFYGTVKFGIVQYMILKTTCVWFSLVLEQFDMYGEGDFDWNKGYPYITLVLNFSQMWALYCLVQFYHATKKELHAIHPLPKFLTFKAVVFVTWWQGVIIAFIFSSGLALRWFSKKAIFRGHVQRGLQDLVICIEMSIAAVVHLLVYPATPYRRESSIMGILAKTMVEEDHGTVARVKESVHDVIFEGGDDVVQDVRITMHQAVEPLESHLSRIRESYHERKETWGGRRRNRKTVTSENRFRVLDEAGSSDSGIVKETAIEVDREVETETETETEGSEDSGSERDSGPVKPNVTVTTEVSFVSESDGEKPEDPNVVVEWMEDPTR